MTVIPRITPGFVHLGRVCRDEINQIHPLGVSGCGPASLSRVVRYLQTPNTVLFFVEYLPLLWNISKFVLGADFEFSGISPDTVEYLEVCVRSKLEV